MRSDIRIRAANRDDIGTIASWQIAMAKETEAMDLDPEIVARGVSHVFDHPSTGFYLMAECSNTAAGCMLVLSEWSDWRAGNVLWLHSVYVIPSMRKLGIFNALYTHVKNLVTSDPTLRGIRLYVDKSNHLAATVYGHLGMSPNHYDLFEWMR